MKLIIGNKKDKITIICKNEKGLKEKFVIKKGRNEFTKEEYNMIIRTDYYDALIKTGMISIIEKVIPTIEEIKKDKKKDKKEKKSEKVEK